MNKPSKINVSLNPETMELLTKVRVSMAETLGFTPSYSQVIQHLIRNEQTDSVSNSSDKGVSND